MSAPVRVRRPRRSRSEIEQLVQQYRDSGLSLAAFCRQQGVSSATLARYRQIVAAPSASPTAFVAVQLAASPSPRSSGLALALGRGLRVEIACGFDPATLAQLLAVLES
jgi:transcriptional regulator with XRE-family HTH domain